MELAKHSKSDVLVFVSPLIRALQTAESFLKTNDNIEECDVVVLPQLT